MRYFVDDVDHSALLRFAEVKGFHALPQIVESSIIDSDTFPALQLPTQYVAAAGAVTRRLPKEAYFYLLPKEFAAVEAFYKEMPSNPRLAKLLSHTSPVIEFSPATKTDESPTEGRIYFCNAPEDPRHPTALKAYEALARYIRKWPKTTDGKLYVGPHLAERCRSGRATITQGRKSWDVE